MKELLRRTVESLSLRNLHLTMTIVLEKLRGLDFSSTMEPEDAGLDPRTSYRSSPSGNRYLSDVLKHIAVTGNDSILDIGCGKGSAMRIMLKFPFARVDGVELSGRVADIAAKNFKKLNVKRARIFPGDASTFEHYDNYSMLYMYNPFPREIMVGVVGNLKRSIDKRDREVLIIYVNPECDDVIVDQGGFSRVGKFPADWGNEIYVYSNRRGTPRARLSPGISV
jgi:SAM-dependent methyltransferase